MAFLKINSGSKSGQRIDIDRDDITIGRASDNVLPIDDSSASSHHCAVVREGRKYTVRDLNSTNGTYLNGGRVSEARLKPGDVLMVGAVEMAFDGDDVDVPPPETRPSLQETVRIDSIADSARAAGPSPFEARRSNRGLWIAVGAVGGAALVGLLAWFLSRMLGR